MSLVEEMRLVARVHGYALAVHGTQKRDLDVIAVPWQEEVSNAEQLVDAIEKELNLIAIRRSVRKPRGRLGYILCGRKWRKGADHQPIDLSVVNQWESA